MSSLAASTSGPNAGSIEAFLSGERALVEAALVTVASRAAEGLAPRVREPVAYALAGSGKRLRPILFVAAYRAARGITGDVPDPVYRLSCAVEIVHTYSLIHDDLPCMDDDTLRRGRPTTHVVYGPAAATVAGAALLPIAMRVIELEGRDLGLSSQERGRLVIELAEAAGAEGMVGGQLLDLQAEGSTVGPEHLEDIHRRKTGALLTSALRMGVLAARGSPELLDALTRYGRALGLAFQITDDLLDIEGDSSEIGKTAGRDIALAKASYPAVHGVEGARRLARARAEEAREAIRGFGLSALEALTVYVVERRR